MQRVQWLRFWLELALLLIGAAVLLLVLRWLGWLSHRAAATALLGLLLCEQLLFAAPYTPQPLARLAYRETPTIARLQQTIGSARMAAAGRLILPPNTTLPYQLRDLRAYEPTASSRYLQYMVSLDPSLSIRETDCCQVLVCPSLTLLSVASVEYYATLPDEDANSCAKRQTNQQAEAGPFVPLWTQGGITLWRNTQVRPRFYFASQVISSEGESQTLRSLASLSLTGREAIIEGAPSVTTQQTIDQGHILVASDLPGEMRLRTQAETGRWLVINEGYDSGWQAEIDGRSTQIHPANEMFQAVYVPAGAHVIHLRYTPVGFTPGAWLSLLSLLALLSLLFFSAPVLARIRKRVRFHTLV